MNGIINAISAFAGWLLSLVVKIFAALFDLLSDVFVNVLDLLLTGFATVLNGIPAPSFLTGASLQTAFSGLSGDVLFFFGVFNIAPGIALLGAGFAFRMTRKFLTLFQW
jgi:hypothetical protein